MQEIVFLGCLIDLHLKNGKKGLISTICTYMAIISHNVAAPFLKFFFAFFGFCPPKMTSPEKKSFLDFANDPPLILSFQDKTFKL